MKKQKQSTIHTDTSIQNKVNDQNHDIQQIFKSFKQDFQNDRSPPINQSMSFLTPTHRAQRRAFTTNSKQKKAMKLIDYIYIRNTVRKNQQLNKSYIEQSDNQLRKSRMAEGKQKAFKTIVEQMIKELKQLSIKASAISELVEDNVVYSGHIDQIARMCNARRILNQNIFGSLNEIQKTIGIGSMQLEAKQQKIASEKQQNQIESQMKRFEDMGIKRLKTESYANDDVKINLIRPKVSNRKYTES